VLLSLQQGNVEQLARPIRFESLKRSEFRALDIARLMQDRGAFPQHRGVFPFSYCNWPCPDLLRVSPRLDLQTMLAGQQLMIRTDGKVGGVLLVGEQAKL
jgi:hypothetical protein